MDPDQRLYDPSTGWEGTAEEFAKQAADRIREAAKKEDQMGRAEQWLANARTVVREMEEYERERLLRAAYLSDRAEHEGAEAEYRGDRSLAIYLTPVGPTAGMAAGGWEADIPNFGMSAYGATAERAIKEALMCLAESTLEDLRDQD